MRTDPTSRGRRARHAWRCAAAMVTAAAVLAVAACSSGSGSSTGGGGGGAAGSGPAWCGSKPIVVGYNSGNDSNGWRKITLSLFKSYVGVCPNIKKVLYTDARGSSQTQISQFNSLIAQGVNTIVTIPDAGQALLPTFRKAMAKGISVVPFTQPPGGTAGKDYTVAVVADNVKLGQDWGEWMCKTLKGKGNVAFMGGVPGNSQSLDELSGVKKAFAESNCSGMTILDPAPVTTNWQVATYQQAMAGLLAKYKQIDGIISDFGGAFVGAVTAFKNANRTIPPVATNTDNTLACDLLQTKTPFVMYTSGNKQVENALQQGVAAYEHTSPPQPALYPQTVVFDTVNGPAGQCAQSLPAGAALGEGLTADQLQKILG